MRFCIDFVFLVISLVLEKDKLVGFVVGAVVGRVGHEDELNKFISSF